MKFRVEDVCTSKEKGEQKTAVKSISLKKDFGIKGDAHAGKWHRQVSFLAAEDIEQLKSEGLKLKPGAFGENIVTRGIDWTKVEIGGAVKIGKVEMQITQIGKECHTPCEIYYKAGKCIMPEKGIFAKVVKGGKINAESSGYYDIG